MGGVRLLFIAAAAAIGSSSLVASAADREFWRHDKGSFVKVDGDKWVERDIQGNVTFNFHERRRTKEFVSLRDRNRKMIIRLKDDGCYFVEGLEDPGDNAKWDKLYDGKWADR